MGGGGAALAQSPKLAMSQVHSLVRWVVTVIFEKLKCSHVLGRPTSGLVGGTSTVKLVKRVKKTSSKTDLQSNKMMECIFCSLVCGGLHKVLLVVIGHSRVQFNHT